MGTMDIFGYQVSEELFMIAVIFLIMTAVLIMEIAKARMYRLAALSAVHAYRDLLMNLDIAGIDLPRTVVDKPTKKVLMVESTLKKAEEFL